MNLILYARALTRILTLLLLVLPVSSCKKFLDAKPDQTLVIPESIQDAQALLDNYSLFNTTYPSIGDQSDDNFFTSDVRYNGWTLYQRTLYSWGLDPVTDLEYANLYKIVLNATIALETVNKIERSSSNAVIWDQVKGSALFYRGYALYHAIEYFSSPYETATASQQLGVPLRPSSDAEERTVRAGMQESWDHIVQQVEAAIPLLPATDIIPSRPTKAAAWAALARIKMAMHSYDKCRDAAKQSLQQYHELINFNTLSITSTSPLGRFNKEVVFPATSTTASQLTPANYSVDSILYNSYSANDLRKTVYFRNNNFGGKSFKANGNGNANGAPFSGIATDEVYLIFAEAAARTGQWQEGMDSLNSLLRTRWKAGTFIFFSANSQTEAIDLILKERRKELILRGTRWLDLRRFNREGLYAVTPKRIIAGTTYTLDPGSKRYTFLFPQAVITISGIVQNQR